MRYGYNEQARSGSRPLWGGADVIATSGGGVRLSNFGNGIANDNTITVGSTPYTFVVGNTELLKALDAARETAFGSSNQFVKENHSKTVDDLLDVPDDQDNETLGYYNGTYTWYTNSETPHWEWAHG